ncbi:MAG: hypothetical protein WEA54_04050 [Actinomycetota bacterium]
MTTVVVLALVVGAIAAAAFVFMGRTETDAASDAIEVIPEAEAVQAQANLDTAMRGAQVYFAENASFAGYGPEIATQTAPGPSYTTGTPTGGAIAIRGVSPTTIVFVTTTASGAPMCVASTGTTVTRGTQDAQTAAGCTG